MSSSLFLSAAVTRDLTWLNFILTPHPGFPPPWDCSLPSAKPWDSTLQNTGSFLPQIHTACLQTRASPQLQPGYSRGFFSIFQPEVIRLAWSHGSNEGQAGNRKHLLPITVLSSRSPLPSPSSCVPGLPPPGLPERSVKAELSSVCGTGSAARLGMLIMKDGATGRKSARPTSQ